MLRERRIEVTAVSVGRSGYSKANFEARRMSLPTRPLKGARHPSRLFGEEYFERVTDADLGAIEHIAHASVSSLDEHQAVAVASGFHLAGSRTRGSRTTLGDLASASNRSGTSALTEKVIEFICHHYLATTLGRYHTRHSARRDVWGERPLTVEIRRNWRGV